MNVKSCMLSSMLIYVVMFVGYAMDEKLLFSISHEHSFPYLSFSLINVLCHETINCISRSS